MDIKVMVTTGGTNLRDDIMRIYQKGKIQKNFKFTNELNEFAHVINV